MKVEEMIAKLSKANPEAVVLLEDWSEGYAPPGECNMIKILKKGVVLNSDWGFDDETKERIKHFDELMAESKKRKKSKK